MRPIVGQRCAGLGGDRREPGDDRLLVGLVGQVLDAVATVGMVADRAAEQHDGAAVGPHRPLVRPRRPAARRRSAPASRRRCREGARAAS